ncbi:MAG TPA: hypothetical protein DCE42_26735 [Myxococcales bacterium]|nr:hypothetical protein [Deltaproteobacteria bacterium]MBU50183.1 hypothetical protein [Deltaproteobacteria bacterium]HAA58388.1 hypothetical protein [Myxococcales bacterium]
MRRKRSEELWGEQKNDTTNPNQELWLGLSVPRTMKRMISFAQRGFSSHSQTRRPIHFTT